MNISDSNEISVDLSGKADKSALETHTSNKSNPHGVTKAQIGLDKVDNTEDSEKSVKYATSAKSAASAGTCTGNAATADVAYRIRTTAPTSYTNGDIWIG